MMRTERMLMVRARVSYIAVAVTLCMLLFTTGCEDASGPIMDSEPVVESVTPDAASMGDTIMVTGSNFSTDPAMIRIAFSPSGFSASADSRYATPVSVSATGLTGVVPDGALPGAVRVENLDPRLGASPLGYLPPPFPSNDMPFDVMIHPGEVGKAFYAGASYEFTLETEAVGEEYVLVLFNSAVPPSRTTTYDYSVGAASRIGITRTVGTAGNGAAAESHGGDLVLLANSGERHRMFERRVRERVRELLEGLTPDDRFTGEAHTRASITGPGAPPQTAMFDVITDPTGDVWDPAYYTTVTADLKYNGTNTLLYVDQSTHPSCITDQDAADLGQRFNDEIYVTNRTYFGSESDLNDDGKVAILLTPVVNEMTEPGTASTTGFISGFFNPVDLIPKYADPDVTNGMEIFYTIVPDPTNQYGNEYPTEFTIEVIRGTLAHEFQHMIMFNYRVIMYDYLTYYMEELWVDEGLSHIAEDLNGHYESNIKRANLFLEDPGNVTLVYGGDALEERGASFLFLRYLGDRFGESIYKKIVQSMRSGMSNIERAAGERFTELFADWSAACYLSGLGITSDPRFNYSSLDLRGDFDPLLVTDLPFPSLTDLVGDVKSMGPEFIDVMIPPFSALGLSIECVSTGRMNAVVIRVQ
jgi:hypothetical protein